MQRRGTRLADVIARDVDRVVALHVRCAVRDAVAHDAHRRRDRIDVLLLRHVLFEDVGLNGARQLVQIVAALLREHDVHRQQNPRGRIDRHRHRDVLQIDAVEQRLHVGERIDRHALTAHLAFAHRMVGVVTHQRRHVEVRRQAGLSLRDEILEAPVGVLAGAEAGDLPHGPQTAAIHRRIRPARERILPGQTDVLLRHSHVERRIDALHRNSAQRVELFLTLFLLLEEAGDLVALPQLELLLQRSHRRRFFGSVHDLILKRSRRSTVSRPPRTDRACAWRSAPRCAQAAYCVRRRTGCATNPPQS